MSEQTKNVSWKQDLAAKRAQLSELQSNIRGMQKALEAGRVDDKEKVNLEKWLGDAEAIQNSPEFRSHLEMEATEKRATKFLAEEIPVRQTEPSNFRTATEEEKRNPLVSTEEYRSAVVRYIANGEANMSQKDREILSKGWKSNVRANVTYSGAQGGYLVPQAVENGLEVATRELIGPETLGADVKTVSGTNDRLIRVRDSSSRKASWVGEAVSDTTTANLAYGQKELKFYKMRTDTFYISRELLVSSDIDTEADFADEMAYEFAYTAAETLTIGDGVGKPEGLLTALVRTGATVNSATSSTVVADDFLLMMNAVGDMHKLTGQFGFAPGFIVGSTMKMKGNSNLYLFRNQITQEILSNIHSRPYKPLTFMPNTPTTTGTVFGVYGKFKAYKIRYLAGGTTMKRIDQSDTAIATDSVGLKGYRDVAAGWCSASGNSTTREAVVGLVA